MAMRQFFAALIRQLLASARHCFMLLFCAAALAGVVFAAGDDLPDLGESARTDLSPQLERKIGQRIMNDIRLREPSYIDDADISDYLNTLGKRLALAAIRVETSNQLSSLNRFNSPNAVETVRAGRDVGDEFVFFALRD
ncbi:MAG: hypothetical protein V4623_03585, partial [Pseudomonadota bacterium]